MRFNQLQSDHGVNDVTHGGEFDNGDFHLI
jgi:hypothetical protein